MNFFIAQLVIVHAIFESSRKWSERNQIPSGKKQRPRNGPKRSDEGLK